MSVLVISLVVWLVVVFLSVTAGIEKNWLSKLTSLHAPIRLAPTNEFYSSYYYQIDKLSAASNYTLKTIGEKAASQAADPYSVDLDAEIPIYWPKADRLSDGALRDPVKIAYRELDALKEEIPGFAFQDYEIGGALLRLTLHRPSDETPSSLSQMSYLLSLAEENPRFRTLLIEPQPNDLNHLLAADPALIEHIKFEEVKTQAKFAFPQELLPIGRPLQVYIQPGDSRVILPLESNEQLLLAGLEKGTVIWDGRELQFQSPSTLSFPKKIQLRLDRPATFKASNPSSGNEIEITGRIQGYPISGAIPFKNIEIAKGKAKIDFDAEPLHPPAWAYFVNGKCQLPEAEKKFGREISAILPKNYRESGVLLGDAGALNYTAPAALSAQEQKIPIRVAGFYDPGILSIGSKCLIVPEEVTKTIHAASQTFSPDGTPTNGLFVWIADLENAPLMKEKIAERFKSAGIDAYWKIATYEQFEFSKDLMLQFQSDRTLLLLIASILLIVACCNIISLLVLLVNDKKKEIAILQSMGASFRSIASIFGLCGIAMGAMSCLIGGSLAVFTLRHLDSLVAFLSALQGRAAFNPAFFGQTLPNHLSYEALLFVLIATPLLSLAAGLIPALKASRIRPSSVLRSE